MRISTNMLYQLSNNDLTGMQGSLIKLQQQIDAQQRVLTPSDDPVAAARALDVTQSQMMNAQYQINRNNADASLSQVNNTLESMTAMLTKIKSNVISAGNASFSNAERANLATELQGNLKEILGYANATDALGNYLFSGFKSTTQPFTTDPSGAIVYNGDQGQQTLQVDSTRQMEISASGQTVFQGNGQDTFKTIQNLINTLAVPVTEAANNADNAAALLFEYPAGSGQKPIAAYKTAQANLDAASPTDPNYGTLFTQAAQAKLGADAANAARTPIPGSQAALVKALGQIGSSLDTQMNNIGAVKASVGARQTEIDNLNDSGAAKNVMYTDTTNNLLGRTPGDLTAMISQLALQQTFLQAAQKTFVSTSSLSLLNYLK